MIFFFFLWTKWWSLSVEGLLSTRPTPSILVLIPVLISRLWSQKSQFQSPYQDLGFESLDSSFDIKTQISKVSIAVSMFRLDSSIFNLCPNLETGPAKENVLFNANPPMCKILLFSKMAENCTYRTAILKVLIQVSILRLQSWKSWIQSRYQDWNLEYLDTSLVIKTEISKFFIPVLISRLKFSISRLQF